MRSQPRPLAQELDRLLEQSVIGSFTRVGIALRRTTGAWDTIGNHQPRHVVITGASSGLGRALALQLAAPTTSLSVVARDSRRLQETIDMVTNAGGVATGYCADLSDAEDLDRLIADLGAQDSVDVLVNNAGALSAHYARSRQGIEHTVAVHVVAPYRLQRDLVMSPRGKVIMMTSGGMYTERFNLDRLEMPEATYRGVTAYARAKRAQVVLTSALQRQHEDDRDFYAVHPGWARTPGLDDSLPGFARTLRPLLRTSAEGVDTTAWLCVQPEGQPSGGGLWLDRRERPIYRLRRTHKNEEDERRDEAALLAWLEARITER